MKSQYIRERISGFADLIGEILIDMTHREINMSGIYRRLLRSCHLCGKLSKGNK